MRKSVWLLSAGLFALSTPAFAQSTDTDGAAAQPTDGATTEAAAVDQAATQFGAQADIVVTATRRNEALSDVPLAVSVVTADSLQNSGASDIRQMQQVSPSLLVSSTQSEGGASTARIRGIGTVGDNPGLESSVGVFIDGVYRSRVGAGLTELGQIDRVEVLRGPQGTLFGRNTSAGLISIITAKPKFDSEFSGEATVGNYNIRRLELSATGGLTESLAARLDGVFFKRDGFMEDIISGRDVNDRDRYLLRGQLLYQPSSDLSVRLIADYSKRDEECCAAPYVEASDAVLNADGSVSRAPSTFEPIVEALAGRTDAVPDDTFDRDVVISPGRSYRGDVKDYGLSGEVVWDFGGAELTSITAYRYNNLKRGTDVDYSVLDLVYRPDDGTAFNRFKTFSQELRIQGEAFGGRLDWLAGGYYANENLRSQDSLRYGDDYGRFTNCLVGANFAAGLAASPNPAAQAAAPLLVTPGSPTCFNTAVAGAVLPAFPAAQQPILAAFARLGVFAGQAFGPSGFENLIRAQVPGLGGFVLADTGFVDDFRQKSNNFAFFTHNIFTITEGLKLTVGARYTSETKRLESSLIDDNIACRVFTGTALAQIPCASPSAPGGNIEIDGKKKENKLSGTVVLSWKPTDNILTYASYSRGYKAGGFNLDRSALNRQISLNTSGQPIAGQICPTSGTLPVGCAGFASADQLEFRPEINDAFELGAKYNGRGIDVNVALFRQLFRDFQLNTFNGVNFIVENINSCDDDLGGRDTDNIAGNSECDGDTRAGVKARGVEVEVFTRPIRNVNFNVGVTYADTKYRSNLTGAGGRSLTPALFQLPGRNVSNAAELTITSAATWTPPIGSSGLRGLVYVDMRRQSSFNTGSDLDIEKVEDGYTVFNARVGLHGPDKAWGVELWANNVFDADYYQVAFDGFLQGAGTERGVRQGFYGRSTQLFGAFTADPRTYGLTLRGRIGGARAPAPVFVAPPAPIPAPATQTCPDGSVILATDACPVIAPPEPVPAPERG